MNSKEKRIVDLLLYDKIIPADGIFQITEDHLYAFVKAYDNLFGNKKGGTKRVANARYARKLAGLTLLKVNKARGAAVRDIRAGIVYMIENPKFTDHYKIGMTLDVHDRLNQYQTYDPYRSFRIVKYEFVLNRRAKELEVLTHPNALNERGEWINKENAITIFTEICNIPQ